MDADSSILQKLDSFFFDRINYERQQSVPYDQRHFRLEPLKFLLEKLGNPQQAYPSIHITGTKGKGSVSAYLGAMFQQAGQKIGIFSSPHLESVCERFRIGEKQVEPSRLLEVVEIIKPAVEFVDRMSQADPEFGTLTFFDLCTAAAFQLFAMEEIQVGIIEVGMGGKLDSTNVVLPEVSVITNVSLDHTAQLGKTISKIAGEKAGIIKPKTPVVSGCQDPEAIKVVHKNCAENQSSLFELGKDFQTARSMEPSPSIRYLEGNNTQEISVNRWLPKHQLQNLAIAVQTLSCFTEKNPSIGLPSFQELINQAAKVSLPGRIELIHQNPPFVLDMAHNPASFQALIETVEAIEKNGNTSGKRTLVFSIAIDKDMEQVLEIASRFFQRIITTKFTKNPRATDQQQYLPVIERIQENIPLQYEHHENLENAITAGKDLWSEGETVVVAGSIFLVAECRKFLD